MITFVICITVSLFSTFLPSPRDYSQVIGQTRMVALGCVSAVLVAYLITGCGPTLTPEDTTHVAGHTLTIERCKAEGREAGTYAAYQACKDDAGIKEGVSP